MTNKKYDKPFLHPRWNQIPVVRVIGDYEVTEEDLKKVEEYERQYFARRAELKKKYEE